MKQTIAQQMGVTEFPFIIRDDKGRITYLEHSDGYWYKQGFDLIGNVNYYENSNKICEKLEFDSDGNVIYFENSRGYVEDKRPKQHENKVVELDGIKYKLVRL